MKKALTVISAILIPVCAFMNLPNSVDGQLVWLGVTGSAVFIAFWVLFNILYKNDRKLMTYSTVLWSVISVAAVLMLVLRFINYDNALFLPLQLVVLFGTAPYISLPNIFTSIYSYNTPEYLRYIGIALSLIIPFAFVVWGAVNRKIFSKKENKNEKES